MVMFLRIGVFAIALTFVQPAYACTVEGKEAQLSVTVTSGKELTFQLGVNGLPGVLQLGGDKRASDQAAVAINGALSFSGSSRISAVSYWTSREIDVADGIVHVTRGMRPQVRAVATSEDVIASIDLDDGVSIPHLSLPCTALTLDKSDLQSIFASHVQKPSLDWLPRKNKLLFQLHPEPGKGVVVEIKDPEGFGMKQTKTVRDWLHLEWRSDDGAALSGWVRKGDVRHPPDGGRGVGGLGGRRAKAPPNCKVTPHFYRGPAEIKQGTKVYAMPGAAAWATLNSSADVEIEVVRPEDAWVAITNVPGIFGDTVCGDLAHAWIPRDAVTLPANREKVPSESPGKWSEGPPLPEPARSNFTATLLADGSVLLAGGRTDKGEDLSQTLILERRASEWRELAPLSIPRSGHTATLLADGKVLIVGGDNRKKGSPLTTSAEILIPRTEGGEPPEPRRYRVSDTQPCAFEMGKCSSLEERTIPANPLAARSFSTPHEELLLWSDLFLIRERITRPRCSMTDGSWLPVVITGQLKVGGTWVFCPVPNSSTQRAEPGEKRRRWFNTGRQITLQRCFQTGRLWSREDGSTLAWTTRW